MQDMDSVLLFFITVLLVAEQMTLQECHRLIFPEPIRNLPVHPDRVLHLNFLLPADQKKPGRHFLTQGEQFVRTLVEVRIFRSRNRHRHLHVPAHSQQLCQKTVLHRSKSGKTIQSKNAVLQDGRLWHPLAEKIQYLFSCNIVLLQIGIESLINFLQIGKFIIQRCSHPCLLHHCINLFFSDIILGKLGDHGFYFADIPLPFQIASKDRQLVLIIPSDLSENQILSLVIQHDLLVPPGLFHHPVGEPSKT